MTTIERKGTPAPAPTPALTPLPTTIPNGEAVAALVAAGIGCLSIGVLTTLNDAYTGVSNFLKLSNDVGPLSGKVIYSLVIWLISWAVLYGVLRGKEVAFQKGFLIALGLVGLGLLGTFPTIFTMIADSLK